MPLDSEPCHPEKQALGPLGLGLVLLLAVLPSLGTLGAPFLAEDASILGRMSQAGAFDDWFQAQYGIEHVVRFWRPVVSMTWWLQAQLSGVEVWPPRLLMLGLHGATALLLGQLLFALGARRPAALLGAALVALFVHQGGTLTWMAGRTDLLVGFWMLLALWCAVEQRSPLAFCCAFLACASKEFGFVLPVWCGMLLWARAWPWPKLMRGLLPVALGCLVAYLWRTLALGVWDGGYAGGGSQFASQLLPGLYHLGVSLAPSLLAAMALVAFGWWRGSLHWRLAWAGLVCALVSGLPLVPLSADLPLEEANERLLLVCNIGLALCMGASLARLPRGGQPSWAPWILALPWLGFSLWQAREDTHQWARAAQLGAQHVERARALGAGLPGSEHPLLVAGVPRNTDGAYCLGLGFSDRFRAPFEVSSRPIWPLRPIFEVQGRERELARELEGGELLRPFASVPRVRLLEWSSAEAERAGYLSFDQRVMPSAEDLSPRITLELDQLEAPAWLEAMVYTELGYGAINLALPVLEPGAPSLSLRSLVGAEDGGYNLAQMLIHAADLGWSRRAYLELRLVDDQDRLLAATPWIETRWADDFLSTIGR